MDARSLHCPNCGAPADPEQGECRYCQATLATVSCPKCFALMFDGAIYCPSCGTRRARQAGAPRQAPCPACRHAVGTVQAATMREVTLGDTMLLECDRCHGLWVDAVTFEHICADHAAQAAVLHQWAPATKADAAPEVRYRRCLACGKMMNRVNFGKLSGTVVDVCRMHGTFLDGGELHQIVAFIQQGGLDRARERRIEELKEEEERLRAVKTQRDILGGANSPVQIRFETRTWTGPDLLSMIEQLNKELK